MELRHLRYFKVLAEELHFRRAATKLNITQPPLSLAIRLLEEEIGAQLLERGRNQAVKLTAAGENFRHWTLRILDESARAKLSTRLIHEGSSGTLAIGHTDDFVADNLPDVLSDFNHTNPGVFLRLVQDTSQTLPERLNSAELDCLFTIKPLPALLANCATITLPPTQMVLVVSTAHRLAGRRDVRLKEIVDEHFLYSPGGRHISFDIKLAKLLLNEGIHISFSVESLSSPIDIEMVRRGHGVTFATLGSVIPNLPGLTTLALRGEDTLLERAFVWQKANNNPALLRFIERIRRWQPPRS